jgi:trehalose-6-phosphate synthase
VLVLSKFTGAAVELRDALIVNPYDIAGVAAAIHTGLEMNRAERRQRMRRMRRYIMEHNIYLWAAKVLGDLREIRIEHEAPVPPQRVDPGTEPAPEIPEEKLA